MYSFRELAVGMIELFVLFASIRNQDIRVKSSAKARNHFMDDKLSSTPLCCCEKFPEPLAIVRTRLSPPLVVPQYVEDFLNVRNILFLSSQA